MNTLDAKVRIVIADDHTIVRAGLRKLLELQPGFSVVGEAATGTDAIRVTTDVAPDLLLLDFAMPGLDGLGVLRELLHGDTGVRVVLLTAEIERHEALMALRLGARGVVLKESAPQLLFKCIRTVMAGELWVERDYFGDLIQQLQQAHQVTGRDRSPVERLTPRELQVIAAIVDGATNRDISERFSLSEQTVKNHISHIFDKLGVSNRLELGLYAVHHRLLERPFNGGEPISSDLSRPRSRRPRR